MLVSLVCDLKSSVRRFGVPYEDKLVWILTLLRYQVNEAPHGKPVAMTTPGTVAAVPRLSKAQSGFLAAKEDGNAKLREGAFDAAVKAYSKALSWCDRMPQGGATVEQRGTVYSNRSCAHLRRADYRQAVKDARDAIEARPAWAKGWFRLAEVFTHIGKYHEALELSHPPRHVE